MEPRTRYLKQMFWVEQSILKHYPVTNQVRDIFEYEPPNEYVSEYPRIHFTVKQLRFTAVEAIKNAA